MAAGLVRNTGLIEIIISTTLTVVIGVLLLKLAIVPLALIVIAFTLILVLYMKFRIGGVTGDVIGAVIELSELMFLFSVIILDKLYSLQHMKLL